jgi:hygromycin-B 7''-O-kinase
MRPALLPVVTREQYDPLFNDVAFGLEAAREICRRERLVAEPVRRVNGSNIVFRVGDDRWLKLVPPFWRDELVAETTALERVEGRLPVPTPRVTARGEVDGWGYLVVTHIEGVAYDVAEAELDGDDRERIAAGVGESLAALHEVSSEGFVPGREAWESFVRERIGSLAERARATGADEHWVREIVRWVDRHRDAITSAPADAILNTDLYFDHLLLSRSSGRWEIAGIIDFGDAMLGARDFDLVSPTLFLFRGDRAALTAMHRAYGIPPAEIDSDRAGRIVAWSFLHGFFRFANWFERELAAGRVMSMEELVETVSPSRYD